MWWFQKDCACINQSMFLIIMLTFCMKRTHAACLTFTQVFLSKTTTVSYPGDRLQGDYKCKTDLFEYDKEKSCVFPLISH